MPDRVVSLGRSLKSMCGLSPDEIRLFLRWSYPDESLSASIGGGLGIGAFDFGRCPGVSVRLFYANSLTPMGVVPKRDAYKGSGKRLMVCPLHGDSNPSMGTIFDRDGVELFNCFGCGRAGTVVELAESVENMRNAIYAKSPLEWVVRGCSGDLGWAEFNRFRTAILQRRAANTLSEKVEPVGGSSAGAVRGYSDSDTRILESAMAGRVAKEEGIVMAYGEIAYKLRATHKLDLREAQKVLIASLV